MFTTERPEIQRKPKTAATDEKQSRAAGGGGESAACAGHMRRGQMLQPYIDGLIQVIDAHMRKTYGPGLDDTLKSDCKDPGKVLKLIDDVIENNWNTLDDLRMNLNYQSRWWKVQQDGEQCCRYAAAARGYTNFAVSLHQMLDKHDPQGAATIMQGLAIDPNKDTERLRKILKHSRKEDRHTLTTLPKGKHDTVLLDQVQRAYYTAEKVRQMETALDRECGLCENQRELIKRICNDIQRANDTLVYLEEKTYKNTQHILELTATIKDVVKLLTLVHRKRHLIQNDLASDLWHLVSGQNVRRRINMM